jgi:hypothetical protein
MMRSLRTLLALRTARAGTASSCSAEGVDRVTCKRHYGMKNGTFTQAGHQWPDLTRTVSYSTALLVYFLLYMYLFLYLYGNICAMSLPHVLPAAKPEGQGLAGLRPSGATLGRC